MQSFESGILFMCGIVGIISQSPVTSLILDSLKRLEYRGYDSAGIATVESGKIQRCRAKGKLVNLENSLKEFPLSGNLGIGHTRWATHGVANEANAHPHLSENVAVVHNGIIENFRDLKEELLSYGYIFSSETDTEVIAHLIEHTLKENKNPVDAARHAFKKLEGNFALALLFRNHDNLIIGVRNGAPLVVGYGNDEMFLASDPMAFLGRASFISYLEDSDCIVLSRTQALIYDSSGNLVERSKNPASIAHSFISKGNYRHFMLKEIYEQPEVISHALAHYVDFNKNQIRSLDLPFEFSSLNRLIISACGTAYFSGMIAKYWFERYAHLPVDVDVASEFRYREPPLQRGSAAFFVSQSGETADTLAALRYCRQNGIPVSAIVNSQESTIARESDGILPVFAGPEIGVASTKAFTCQLAVMAVLAIHAGVMRNYISQESAQNLIKNLSKIPVYMRQILNLSGKIENIAHQLTHYRHVLYMGRGISYPLALEGALKLKEISYIHAEGYAAGELKHGPIALVDENMPIIVIAPFDRMFPKILSNMQEVATRGGKIILFTDEEGANQCTLNTLETLVLPQVEDLITPILYALPIQMLAYFTAVSMGTDVDQPRNLAKSVTVE